MSDEKPESLLFGHIVAQIPNLTGAELCKLKEVIVDRQMELEDNLICASVGC
jgi:hypothetical protein